MSVCEILPYVEEADVSTLGVVTPASVLKGMNSRPMEKLAKVFIFRPVNKFALKRTETCMWKKINICFPLQM